MKKKIYELRNNNFDIFENNENFIIYKINSLIKKKPDINNLQTKNEILNQLIQENKFEYNKKLLEKIRDKKIDNKEFSKLGKDQIKFLTLNSVKDNKRFDINSVEMLYSMPLNSFALISDENKKVYLAEIKNYKDVPIEKDTDIFKSYIAKENTNNKNTILKSYDIYLNSKYKVDINQIAIDNVKNLFQ